MKARIILTLCTLACFASSCNKVPPINLTTAILGEWVYDVPDDGRWEVMKFTDSGVFYYSTQDIEWKVKENNNSGRYSLTDNNIFLAYKIHGVSLTMNMTIIDINEYQFTALFQDIGAQFTYSKLLAHYEIKPESSVTIELPNISKSTIQGYSSHNPSIATVSQTGTITGVSSGLTYIDIITDEGTAVVEVVTFDEENMFDDYSFALCKTIPEVIEVMGEGFFYKGDNGVLYLSNNYVVDTVTFMVGLKDVTHIEFVEMSVNSNVTRSQIINSMKKKYNYAESSNGVHHFLTGSFIDRAPVSITYDENRSVVYYSYLYAREPWLEYWKLCGMSREEVQEEMSQMGNTFVISDYSYSANGSDYYYITGSEYAYMVGFVFNAYNQVCEYWVYLNEGITKNQINNTLKLKFDFSSAESTGDSFVYYGAGQRFRIVYAPDIVTLNDKFQAPFTPAAQQAWPDVANGLGMTHNQIVKEFGTPYLLMDEYISYFSNNEYINFYTFYFDSKTDYEFVNYVGITLRENANTAKIVEYLSSQYTPFPNGTLEDGSQYAWINSDSSIEIIYYVSMSSIMYMKLN